MALETAPFEVDIDWLVREVQQLGLSRSDDPGLNERRLFVENGKYLLKIWDGSAWKNIQPEFDQSIISTVNGGEAIRFDGGHASITTHDGYGNFNLKSGVDVNHTIVANDGGSHIEMSALGEITISTSDKALGEQFEDKIFLKIQKTQFESQVPIFWHKGETLNLANNVIHNTGIAYDAVGFLLVKNGTYTNERSGAIYTTGCAMNVPEKGCVILKGANTYYGDIKDEQEINVYADTDDLIKIQNVSGGSVTLKYVFKGGLV